MNSRRGMVLAFALAAPFAYACGAAPSNAPPEERGGAAAVDGERIWMATCEKCHGAGGLGDAPAIGDAAAWQPRIARGMDTLETHALAGFTGQVGEMPARGGNAKLSDEEVRAAVAHMVSKSE